MMRTLRVAAADRRDEGLTLTELLVAMMITALALAIFGGFFVNIATATSGARSSREATGVAANAIDEIGRVVRAAASNPVLNSDTTPAVAAGTAGTLTVIAYVDTSAAAPSPTQVGFALNSAGALVETRISGVSSNGYWVFTGATTTRTIAVPRKTGDLQVAFAYNDQDGAPITIAPSGITRAQALLVQSVTVTVTVANRNRAADDPVSVTTTAVMPNVKLS